MKSRSFFYGYINAIICFIVIFIGMGFLVMNKSIYTTSICKEYNLTRVAFTTIASVASVIGAVCQLFYGRILRRFHLKHAMIVGIIGISLSYLLIASGWGLWSYVTGTLTYSVFCMFTSLTASSKIILNWFHKKSGLVVGIIYAASGAGGAVASPILGKLLTAYGWKVPCIFASILTMLCAIPVAIWMIETPEEIGQEPFGGYPEVKFSSGGILFENARKDYHFWIIALGVVLVSFSSNSSYNNISPHLESLGYQISFISSYVMVVMLFGNSVSKPILGAVGDKAGLTAAVLISGTASLTGSAILGLIDSTSPAFALLGSGLMGFGTSMSSIIISLVISKTFGLLDYSSFMGMTTSLSYVGTIVGPMFASHLYDTYGTYSGSYQINAIVMCLAIILILIGSRRKPQKNH